MAIKINGGIILLWAGTNCSIYCKEKPFGLGDQHFGAGEAAASHGLLGDDPKPALDLVKPEGVGGCVVHMKAGSLHQPVPDLPLRGRPSV